MHSLQPKVEDLPDQVHEAFEEIRHWSGGWAVPIDKLKDKPLLQEKNEVVAIEEPVVEEMLPEPFRPSASVLGDRSRQPTPAKRGLGRHRNNNGPKTIDIGKT